MIQTMHFCILLFVISLVHATEVPQHTQYVATVHYTGENHGNISKRDIEDIHVGNLVYNNTPNENGEVTISICDITQNIFNSRPEIVPLELFKYDQEIGISPVATARLRTSFGTKVNINGCLVFFFNPCCETFGMRIALQDPVSLSATGNIDVRLEAFGIAGSLGAKDIDVSPLKNINLAGLVSSIGSWNLPPILDQFLSVSNKQFCAKFGIPGVGAGLEFCVRLTNFTAGVHGVKVCPRLGIKLGTIPIYDVSYTALVNGAPECLNLSFVPTCSHNGASVAPSIVQAFKSADENNDQKITAAELSKNRAMYGQARAENNFGKMDVDGNGEVDFVEFQTYTNDELEQYNRPGTDNSKEGEGSNKFTGAHIAAAVIVTMIGTTLIVVAVLAVVAQYKGVINISWLGKVIPKK